LLLSFDKVFHCLVESGFIGSFDAAIEIFSSWTCTMQRFSFWSTAVSHKIHLRVAFDSLKVLNSSSCILVELILLLEIVFASSLTALLLFVHVKIPQNDVFHGRKFLLN
jgi:hypothetical protein